MTLELTESQRRVLEGYSCLTTVELRESYLKAVMVDQNDADVIYIVERLKENL